MISSVPVTICSSYFHLWTEASPLCFILLVALMDLILVLMWLEMNLKEAAFEVNYGYKDVHLVLKTWAKKGVNSNTKKGVI